MKVLYVCAAEGGGIAEYTLRQVPALADAGAEVTVLCRPGFPIDRLPDCQVVALLPSTPLGENRCQKVVTRIQDERKVARAVIETVVRSRCDAVLMACYSEYFAPFWAGLYRAIEGKVPIGTIAHDPVRDFVVGPRWWHRWSVRLGYSFVTHVFVHDDTPIDYGGKDPVGITEHRVPHGPYELPPPIKGRNTTRQHYGIKNSDHLFLAFGQIRDGKNLDRFLKAMPRLDANVKLLVVGTAESASQRPPRFYQELARELQLDDRCFWDIRYVPESETGDIFAAADTVLMTYSARFRSASGVLNSAVSARKPVLASSGPGPLCSAVTDYSLGVFISPDNDQAVHSGVEKIMSFESEKSTWSDYEKDHSWEENARQVVRVLKCAS